MFGFTKVYGKLIDVTPICYICKTLLCISFPHQILLFDVYKICHFLEHETNHLHT